MNVPRWGGAVLTLSLKLGEERWMKGIEKKETVGIWKGRRGG